VFDILSRRIPWVVAALMALGVTGVPVAAQSDVGMDPAAVSNVNAHRVDGRHAVKMTSNVNLRAGRLMAFSAQGYLPANIVQGGVATIAALQSSAGAVNEADNPVHWNQISGVPATIADGVDEGDGYESTVRGPFNLPANATAWFSIDVSIGNDIDVTFIPTAAGGEVQILSTNFGRVDANWVRHWYEVKNWSAVNPVDFRIRLRTYNQDIAPAALKKAAKNLKVEVVKRRSH
jgi:hypothetical protein